MNYSDHGKRILDVVLAVLALTTLAPVLLAIALLIRLRLGAPVFFRQRRPGRFTRPFEIVKFRTMADLRDKHGSLLPDAARVTRLGRFLRRTSLDELPELFNVLRGDMSLVGPRPLLMRYLPHFSETEWARFQVAPGISGWAQINGRNDLNWEDRFRHDVWYVEHLSLKLDLKILFLTLVRVFRRQNVRVVPGLSLPDLDQARGRATGANL